jgi:hypothetical protein
MRVFASGLISLVVLLAGLPAGTSAQTPPLPDPNFAGELTPSPCQLDTEDPYERRTYEIEGWGAETDYTRYPGDCRRMRFAYGPIVVKPGNNDALIGPVTIEKPAEDGYITRFKPNLVLQDGSVPPVERVHLHHGTWLSEPSYGSGPFFASGEEKTIAPFPKGYGMPVKASDTWLLLHMVHSAVPQAMLAWITYEVDFIPKARGDALGIKPALPLWLDVRPSSYPVFNVQRKFDGGDGECTWPKEQCADFNSWGETEVGQGQPGNGVGTDLRLPQQGGSFGIYDDFQGGTLIGMGGHVHPGGIRNEIDLVRGEQSQRIYNGVPTYWARDGSNQPGGPPTSWDLSMRVSGLPSWGVRVEPGDVLRSNVAYDTTYQSSWENMGIAVGLLVPDDPNGNPQAPGLDPFGAPIDGSERCDSGGLEAATPTLCPNGSWETHGQYPENTNYSGPSGETLDGTADGPETNEVAIADFLYTPGDLSTRQMFGIPQVPLGSNLRFTNVDGPAVLHTITTCKYPCLGPTGSAFPLSDGETSTGRLLDLDSSELGFGVPEVGPAKQRPDWTIPVTQEEGYQPGETVTYFCRVHPSMRGAFKVTE